MNNTFSNQYLTILRRQVEEEIQFLVAHGHDNDKLYVPCMFCASRGNYYTCTRINTLRTFLHSIKTHNESKPRRIIPNERKQIGLPARDYPTHQSCSLEYGGKMPLLYVEL